MEIKATTRKWGNSIAVVIPRAVVEKQRIQKDQEIRITIEKQRPRAAEFFGIFKDRFKESTQNIKDEMRRGWKGASDRRRW